MVPLPFVLIFGIALFACAERDYHTGKIPDFLLALLWLVPAVLDYGAFANHTIVLMFAGIYLLNVWKNEWGWGDVLALPPVLGVLASISQWAFIPVIVAIVLSGWVQNKTHERQPLLPYVFAGYLIGFLVFI